MSSLALFSFFVGDLAFLAYEIIGLLYDCNVCAHIIYFDFDFQFFFVDKLFLATDCLMLLISSIIYVANCGAVSPEATFGGTPDAGN